MAQVPRESRVNADAGATKKSGERKKQACRSPTATESHAASPICRGYQKGGGAVQAPEIAYSTCTKCAAPSSIGGRAPPTASARQGWCRDIGESLSPSYHKTPRPEAANGTHQVFPFAQALVVTVVVAASNQVAVWRLDPRQKERARQEERISKARKRKHEEERQKGAPQSMVAATWQTPPPLQLARSIIPTFAPTHEGGRTIANRDRHRGRRPGGAG